MKEGDSIKSLLYNKKGAITLTPPIIPVIILLFTTIISNHLFFDISIKKSALIISLTLIGVVVITKAVITIIFNKRDIEK